MNSWESFRFWYFNVKWKSEIHSNLISTLQMLKSQNNLTKGQFIKNKVLWNYFTKCFRRNPILTAQWLCPWPGILIWSDRSIWPGILSCQIQPLVPSIPLTTTQWINEKGFSKFLSRKSNAGLPGSKNTCFCYTSLQNKTESNGMMNSLM